MGPTCDRISSRNCSCRTVLIRAFQAGLGGRSNARDGISGRHRFSKTIAKDLTILEEGRSGDCDLSSSILLAVAD